jgi:hypothetical protein
MRASMPDVQEQARRPPLRRMDVKLRLPARSAASQSGVKPPHSKESGRRPDSVPDRAGREAKLWTVGGLTPLCTPTPLVGAGAPRRRIGFRGNKV